MTTGSILTPSLKRVGTPAPDVGSIPWTAPRRAVHSTQGSALYAIDALRHDMDELEAENLRHGSADEHFNWEIPVQTRGSFDSGKHRQSDESLSCWKHFIRTYF